MPGKPPPDVSCFGTVSAAAVFNLTALCVHWPVSPTNRPPFNLPPPPDSRIRLANGASKAGTDNAFGDEQLDVDLAADEIIFDEFKVMVIKCFWQELQVPFWSALTAVR